MSSLSPRIFIGDLDFYENASYILTSRTGWDTFSGLSGSNLRVPGKHGEVWVRKDYEPARMVLDIYVTALNAAGGRDAGLNSEQQFRKNMNALMTRFKRQDSLITVSKQHDPDGSYEQIFNYAEVTALLTPDYVEGDDPSAKVTVELTFPNPIWLDILPKNITGTASASTARTVTLTALAGMTAPVTDAIILVTGPVTNPNITDSRTGATIQYNGTVAAGSKWRINCLTFQSEVGTTLSYDANGYVNTNTGTNVLASTQFTPGPNLFTIGPNEDLSAPTLSFTGSGTSTATKIDVCARKKFLA